MRKLFCVILVIALFVGLCYWAFLITEASRVTNRDSQIEQLMKERDELKKEGDILKNILSTRPAGEEMETQK